MVPTFFTPYCASENRYSDGEMIFNRCGTSGLTLPALSLGFWWNFGGIDPIKDATDKMKYAFDHGIFCFDFANNYGPPYGSAEENFGRIYQQNFKPYRHELVVTSKAGYDMWPGPNGRGSSRKMILTSIDESLQRMNLDYVDVFYSHRYDGVTPLEETMEALAQVVRQGKAIYVGLSNYPLEKLEEAIRLLSESRTPCVIYQGRHSMLSREVEGGIIPLLREKGVGFTSFSPLAKGILTDKYLKEIPSDSRAALSKHFNTADLTPEMLTKIEKLNQIALERGQTLAQMAVSWLLAIDGVTSVIIGPRTMEQLTDLAVSVKNIHFSDEEKQKINSILFS